MDLNNLEKILNIAIDPSGSEHIRLKESLIKHAQDIGWEHVEAFMYHDLSKPVQEELESLPLYKDYKGLFANEEKGGSGFHPFMVAPELVRISFKKGVKAAISYFCKMTSLPFADGYATNLLLGIDIDKSFEILPGVQLVRIDDLPDSYLKEHYLGDDRKWHFNNPHSEMIGKPRCALVKKLRIEPLLYSSEKKPEKKNPHENSKLFEEISLLLTLIGLSPVLTSIYWFSFEDRDLQGAKQGGGGWHNHEILPFFFFEKFPIATDAICETVSSYFSMTDIKTKKRILVSLERLSFSLRRRSNGDAAVELSIALESIFAEDFGENTYKIGLRVALLIGGDFDQRKRIRSIIAALYKQRSQFVHRGEYKNKITPKGFEPIEAKEMIKEAASYVAQSLKKIINLGAIPDWNEYELGSK